MPRGNIITLTHNSANNRKLIIYKTSKLNWGCPPPNCSFDGKIKLRSLCHLIHVYAWCNILMLTDAVIFIPKCEHSKEELINLWHILLLHHSNVLRGPLVRQKVKSLSLTKLWMALGVGVITPACHTGPPPLTLTQGGNLGNILNEARAEDFLICLCVPELRRRHSRHPYLLFCNNNRGKQEIRSWLL